MANPDRLLFLKVDAPGQPLRLTWRRPRGAIRGFMLLSTQNPFPPEMAPEFFAGRMTDFFKETPLGPESGGHETESAAPYYCVLAYLDTGWQQVQGLHVETELRGEAPLALDPLEATQPRTMNRGRLVPTPTEDDFEVQIFVRSDRPDDEALAAMLSGFSDPDYQLTARCDGFIDNVTGEGFRVHYAAVAVDVHGHHRPLRLQMGGFQPLTRPALLDKNAQQRVTDLHNTVVAQLEAELQRKSVTVEELTPMLARATELLGDDSRLDVVRARVAKRFP